jgi:hydroxymethylbilane synthase
MLPHSSGPDEASETLVMPISASPTTRTRARLTYATRRSPLALAQSRAFVAALIARSSVDLYAVAPPLDLHEVAPALDLRELEVVTTGDRVLDRPLADIGGKGVFVKEIEEALLEGRADFAVHSMKDVPAALPPGLTIACIPRRAEAGDVLVAPRYRTLDALPPGARVGTSSLRRARCIEAVRPDLGLVPLRGNVDTRLRKVDEREYDGVVLARAGLKRLGLEGRATDSLPLGIFVPAPGQGALAIECREDDAPTRAQLALLHDHDTAVCVTAERGVLEALGGDCRTPLGAYAERSGDLLRLRAFVAGGSAAEIRRAERAFAWPDDEAAAADLGRAVGKILSQEMPQR